MPLDLKLLRSAPLHPMKARVIHMSDEKPNGLFGFCEDELSVLGSGASPSDQVSVRIPKVGDPELREFSFEKRTHLVLTVRSRGSGEQRFKKG